METRLTLRPGQNGTRKLAERFGKRLVCVRYRYDETLRKRYTTGELIVAESAWTPKSRKPRSTRSPDDMVYVRIGYGEEGLRANLKALPCCRTTDTILFGRYATLDTWIRL